MESYPNSIASPHYLNDDSYQELYLRSIADLDGFWNEMAQTLSWILPWDQVLRGSLEQGNLQWFSGAQLNVCYNCVDRHLVDHADRVAFYWEADHPQDSFPILYQELHDKVCQFANLLKKLSVKKGDTVCIYLPMIPEAIYAMLACARIGAIHTVVFSGFSSQALADRLIDSECKIIITADEAVRAGKSVPLKLNVDTAIEKLAQIQHVIVVRRTGVTIPWNDQKDICYKTVNASLPTHAPIEPMQATDPLFILYTSGSTGKPKGVVHSSGGYLVYVATTFRYVFNYHPEQIFWCGADIGWITGHSYLVYGALVNGATSVLYEGVPNHPTPARIWQIVDKYQVNILYIAPTLIRMLMREGDKHLKESSRESLQLLGSVGEPINPAAWEWYYQVVGNERCPIVDTWWQTETGGVLISPIPGVGTLKPGYAMQPFLGIVPNIMDEQGNPIIGAGKGNLVISKPWPGMLSTLFRNPERLLSGYYHPYPGSYFTGDCAVRDAEGNYLITGRVDDVLNVSGHRLSTAEIESAVVSHASVAEAAVVGFAHPLKGEGIFAFVTAMEGAEINDALTHEVKSAVRKRIGAIAVPDIILWSQVLPKTRSGKILRRLLRKIANQELENLGDLSTLADESVLETILNQYKIQIP